MFCSVEPPFHELSGDACYGRGEQCFFLGWSLTELYTSPKNWFKYKEYHGLYLYRISWPKYKTNKSGSQERNSGDFGPRSLVIPKTLQPKRAKNTSITVADDDVLCSSDTAGC